MNIYYELNGDLFVWDTGKAEKNLRKHGIRFEEAATVFSDPLFVLTGASRNDEARDAAIGFDVTGPCSMWFILRLKDLVSVLFPRAAPNQKRNSTMLSERLKKRLQKNRPMTSITLRIPVDVVESLKEIAPHKGFSGYQTLLKSYISEGLRRDEERYSGLSTARLIEALKKCGVSDAIIEEATRDLADSQ
ncbi:BrnT family toxin [Nitrosomonas sp.]|uniref:BrnT family toxin n=1 Tax=Nitrosomonas sp. TaxID=42353 RepID=UPI0025D59D25|nr:BrnT family toxin [Nitrosomonas sp.]